VDKNGDHDEAVLKVRVVLPRGSLLKLNKVWKMRAKDAAAHFPIRLSFNFILVAPSFLFLFLSRLLKNLGIQTIYSLFLQFALCLRQF
jgi:hypothetical protein